MEKKTGLDLFLVARNAEKYFNKQSKTEPFEKYNNDFFK